MKLLELLNVLSPDMKLIIEYDNDEGFIAGYTVQYVNDQVEFFDKLGIDIYKRLEVVKIDYVVYNGDDALYVYCMSQPYLHKKNNTIF